MTFLLYILKDGAVANCLGGKSPLIWWGQFDAWDSLGDVQRLKRAGVNSPHRSRVSFALPVLPPRGCALDMHLQPSTFTWILLPEHMHVLSLSVFLEQAKNHIHIFGNNNVVLECLTFVRVQCKNSWISFSIPLQKREIYWLMMTNINILCEVLNIKGHYPCQKEIYWSKNEFNYIQENSHCCGGKFLFSPTDVASHRVIYILMKYHVVGCKIKILRIK